MDNNLKLSEIKHELMQRKIYLLNSISLVHLDTNLVDFTPEEKEAREVIIDYITKMTPLLDDEDDLLSLSSQIQVDHLINNIGKVTFYAIELIEHFINVILLYESKKGIFSKG